MKEKKSIFENPAVQSILASLLCILLGLLIGFLVLLFINPSHAVEGMTTILKNYLTYPSAMAQKKYLGTTLVKTAPLLMCALSIQLCYQAGMFNIGAAGQYVVGAGISLYAAVAWKLPWYVCLFLAMAAGALWAAIVGVLKVYRNVNEVISGIMLNWLALYLVNMLLTGIKEKTSPHTIQVGSVNPGGLLPKSFLSGILANNRYVTIAIPLSVLVALLMWFLLKKTVFGYEVRATGLNLNAAKYCGMREKKNIIITLMIGGIMAGAGAAFLYLSGYEQWQVTQTSVPAMGFNGIAATFLGGVDPIGTIFASYFIQHISSGGTYLDKMIFPSQIADLISAIIIYLCGFVLFFKLAMTRRAARKGGKV